MNTIKPDKKFYKKCIYVLSTISAVTMIPLIIFIALYIFSSDLELKEISIVLSIIWIISQVLIWAISIPIIKLWIKNLAYVIQDDRVTIHKGILTKTQQNIPYRSVTDFSLKRTIYDRLLGLGSINIQTAGQSKSASGYEGSLIGLIDYENLHSELKEKLKKLHPVSESTTTSEPVRKSDESVLIQMLEELKKIRRNLEKQ